MFILAQAVTTTSDWNWGDISERYGPVVTVILLFAIRELWPWFRDKFLPARAKERLAVRREAARAVTEELKAGDLLLERVVGALEKNAVAWSEMRLTMGDMRTALQLLPVITAQINALSVDINRIYDTLNIPRPSAQAYMAAVPTEIKAQQPTMQSVGTG